MLVDVCILPVSQKFAVEPIIQRTQNLKYLYIFRFRIFMSIKKTCIQQPFQV